MKFKIIPNKQTPKIDYDEKNFNIKEFIISNDLLIRKFYSFARRQHKCTGLAANQVSVDGERLMKPFFTIKYDYIWDIIIAPKIIKYIGKKEEKSEGCLSWLGKRLTVNRYPEIEVSYYNFKGELITEIITGYKAQIFQHEYDHLIGVEEKFSTS